MSNPLEEVETRVLSVYELAQGLKRTVEGATSGRWVEGEVGRLVRPSSGHLYFTLKDEQRDATVDCVMYKRDAFRFGKQIGEGARVQLRGRASFYPPRGRLQWIAEVARPSGKGALLEALEKLKKRLMEEGLTAPERKRALPSDPRVVGVITSKSGAAFHDVCSVAQRRGPVRLLLSPALVQGDGAVASLTRALLLLQSARPDVIIIGRGGGSAEDLMAFNDESFVRMVAACPIPTVSAVGHEIDLSLMDLVADARAATPSQAAELVVPDAQERTVSLRRMQRHLARAMQSRLVETRLEFDRTRASLSDPRFVLADAQQALDGLRTGLSGQLRAGVSHRRERLERLTRRLYARHPRAVLAGARARLGPLRARLSSSLPRRLEGHSAELNARGRALAALSPLSVLGRGFALATRADGMAIRDVDELSIGQEVEVRVRRGSFEAKVQKVLSKVENSARFAHESSAARAAGKADS